MLRNQKKAMLAAMFAACALFGANADARSQQPPPSSREHGQPAQAQPNGPEQPAATDQRGTEQSPVIAKVLPTPKTDAETAQEAEDRKEKSANDRNLVRYTGYLDAFTAILAAIGCFQLAVFAYQAWTLQQTVIAAKQSADAAKSALIATARPKIIVRKVEAIFSMPPNRSVSAQFEITNVGGSRTVLIERNAILDTSYKKRGNPFPKYVGSAVSNEHWLQSGEPLHATANFADPRTDPSEENIRSGASQLFLFGYVRYRDETGVVREMGFGRQFDPQANRFRPLNDPEVEYRD